MNNKETAIELLKESIYDSQEILDKKTHLESTGRWNSDYVQKIIDGMVNKRTDEIMRENSIESIIALPNIFEFSEYLDNSVYSRKTPLGETFYHIETETAVIFSGTNISVNVSNEKIMTCESVDDLLEKVLLDMRTKKFKNVLKRKDGAKFSKEIEKVDMRKKDFRDSMKRKFKKSQSKKMKLQASGIVKEEIDILFESSYNIIQEIAELTKGHDDFKRLLMNCQNNNLNPLPLKRLMSYSQNKLKENRNSSDVKYFTQNAKLYKEIADHLFG